MKLTVIRACVRLFMPRLEDELTWQRPHVSTEKELRKKNDKRRREYLACWLKHILEFVTSAGLPRSLFFFWLYYLKPI
jgi:hypothetical protein